MREQTNKDVLMDMEALESLLSAISALGANLRKQEPALSIYNNKQVQELLHINDKLIRKYREQGLIGYTKVGDKYWYTRKDVEAFLKNCHHQAFS